MNRECYSQPNEKWYGGFDEFEGALSQFFLLGSDNIT
jgi:hypothetical protein